VLILSLICHRIKAVNAIRFTGYFIYSGGVEYDHKMSANGNGKYEKKWWPTEN
jgi:hypothetical protein